MYDFFPSGSLPSWTRDYLTSEGGEAFNKGGEDVDTN